MAWDRNIANRCSVQLEKNDKVGPLLRVHIPSCTSTHVMLLLCQSVWVDISHQDGSFAYFSESSDQHKNMQMAPAQ